MRDIGVRMVIGHWSLGIGYWALVALVLLGGFVGFADVVVRPGDVRDEDVLRYGWSHAERFGGESMRWIEKSEGELLLPELDTEKDQVLTIEAMPICADNRIQNMGVFINGRYLTEWVMTTNGVFDTYEAKLPAKRLQKKDNTIIIRGGFLYSPEGEPRELSIAVKKIELKATD